MTLTYTADRQDQSVLLSCNDGRQLFTDRWEDIASFLLMPCDMALVFNIDKFVDTILPKDIKESLKGGGRVYSYDNRKLYYQPGRMLGINHIDFYGLSRYSDNEITNVMELAELATKVMKAYGFFGVTPARLTSPVAVYGETLDKVDFPRACDLPDSAFDMLSKCAEVSWEEWREVYKLGHWEANEITDYDLTSAYPYLISLLPDLRGAKFFTSKTMPANYSWGLLQGKLKINKDVTPFLHIGEWDRLITTDHLWLIDRYQLGQFEMEQGWFYLLPVNPRYPFSDTMQMLYKARQNENPLVQKIAKAISVGIGGKFAQRYDNGKLGDNYNSIYATLITSRCQVKVADFIWRNNLSARCISVLVDGCLVEGKRLQLSENGGMGSWRANPPSPFLVASLLYQWGLDKKPDGHTYDAIMELIRAKPNQPIYDNIDLNLLDYDRLFSKLPKTGAELLRRIYTSVPITIASTHSSRKEQ